MGPMSRLDHANIPRQIVFQKISTEKAKRIFPTMTPLKEGMKMRIFF